jgi:ubiquitin carboxyl-terminal hydrolase 7
LTPCIYILCGVLVHSGNIQGGDYYALIKPDQNTRWLKFKNELVTPAADYEVLEDTFGGEPLNLGRYVGAKGLKRETTAYMLVYIRQSAIDDVLAPLREEDTPAHLGARNFSFFNLHGILTPI